MNSKDRIIQKVFQSALLWGGVATAAFYTLIKFGATWFDPWLLRCFTGRWEAYLCASLFFVGLASLLIRGIDVVSQSLAMLRHNAANDDNAIAIAISADEPVEISDDDLLDQSEKRNVSTNSYLQRRLASGLDFASRTTSGKAVADQLRYLAENDRAQMDRRYELAKFTIWALPAVGSLATVLGIGAAISQLTATNSAELIQGVVKGLDEAFDTFALGLALSILLVMFKFVTKQGEERLLVAVDEKVNTELQSHIVETSDVSASAQMEQLRILSQTVAKATERLAQQQSSPTMRPAPTSAGNDFDEKKIETMMARAMANVVQQQGAPNLAPTGAGMDLAGWKPLQQALQQVATYLARQQAKQENEGEVVQQLIDIIGDELKDDQPIRRKPELRMHIEDDAAASLWK